ncbi:uncharacterized protein [Solanum lycopersicum]|uniref:Uncharacterized protein n=1 Tax=Solanum lycopersicum TaxID=4081 RepID=A0A3Q7FXA2_SOLLC|nr:uncharacterized protein LOC109119985 [Solanum lycopersicum]
MKERGKAAMETDTFSDFNYSVSSDMPCKKHPSSSSIGICSYCLKEKLVNLVCSECGEQRLSSCSCSDSSEVGRIGRISSLLENEKKQSMRGEKTEQVIVLRRSNSSCVEIKKNSNGFWKIKRFFSKKKKKGVENGNDLDENSDIWVSDAMAVSRSRSVCSFRGNGFNDTDEGSDYRFSSAKISDVTGGILMDSSDEPRKSGFRSIFPVKEADFTSMDDSAFIDLKLDLSIESNSNYLDSNERVGLNLSGFKSGSSNGAFGHSGSCRMTRSGGKGNKVWKWIFKQSSRKS